MNENKSAMNHLPLELQQPQNEERGPRLAQQKKAPLIGGAESLRMQSHALFLVVLSSRLDDVRNHQRDDHDKGNAQQPKDDRHENLHLLSIHTDQSVSKTLLTEIGSNTRSHARRRISLEGSYWN
jgi:hypothetical protein